MAEVSRDCRCGGSLRAGSTVTGAAEGVARIFDERHTGEGHGPVTARQAARARARDLTEGTEQ